MCLWIPRKNQDYKGVNQWLFVFLLLVSHFHIVFIRFLLTTNVISECQLNTWEFVETWSGKSNWRPHWSVRVRKLSLIFAQIMKSKAALSLSLSDMKMSDWLFRDHCLISHVILISFVHKSQEHDFWYSFLRIYWGSIRSQVTFSQFKWHLDFIHRNFMIELKSAYALPMFSYVCF